MRANKRQKMLNALLTKDGKRLIFRRSYNALDLPFCLEKENAILAFDLKQLADTLKKDLYVSTLDKGQQDKLRLYFSAVLRGFVNCNALCELFIDEALGCALFEIHSPLVHLSINAREHFAALAYMSEHMSITSKHSEYGSIHVSGFFFVCR